MISLDTHVIYHCIVNLYRQPDPDPGKCCDEELLCLVRRLSAEESDLWLTDTYVYHTRTRHRGKTQDLVLIVC